MVTTFHFINVGLGNMTLIQFLNGTNYLYDCNVTDANEDHVLGYLGKVLGENTSIDAFICFYRDADHMRGLAKVFYDHPIPRILDAGVSGTTTDSPEYRDYMALRRILTTAVIKPRTFEEIGGTTIRWMNS